MFRFRFVAKWSNKEGVFIVRRRTKGGRARRGIFAVGTTRKGVKLNVTRAIEDLFKECKVPRGRKFTSSVVYR